AGRVRRIYYGIDPSPFEGGDRSATRGALGLADGTHVGLCVARFHPQKDHATLFRAVRRLVDEGRDVRLLLAGGDPFYDHRARAEADVRALGLSDAVTFLGIRDDVPDLLAACDVFVLPSLYEGLGLVYLEAMAASRPVLATRSSAIPEVVLEGETGDLIDVGDDAALAAAWGALADDPARGESFGRAGRDRVEAVFGLDRMIDETLAVYREAGASV
ncbi:MAG: glycosyltransferase family 4 protein, partial [Planctomycetota bacterium JB042]